MNVNLPLFLSFLSEDHENIGKMSLKKLFPPTAWKNALHTALEHTEVAHAVRSGGQNAPTLLNTLNCLRLYNGHRRLRGQTEVRVAPMRSNPRAGGATCSPLAACRPGWL